MTAVAEPVSDTQANRATGPVRHAAVPPNRTGPPHRTEPVRLPQPDRFDTPNRTGPAADKRTAPPGWGFALGVLILAAGVIGFAAFRFSFTNIRHLAVSVGIPAEVAPWISPVVDAGVVSLMIVTQFLILAGVAPKVVRPAVRLLVACGAITLLLNSAAGVVEAIATHDLTPLARAAVDAVVPLLLLWWSHVAPGLVRAFVELRARYAEQRRAAEQAIVDAQRADRDREAARVADEHRARLDAQAAAERQRLDAHARIELARLEADERREAAERDQRATAARWQHEQILARAAAARAEAEAATAAAAAAAAADRATAETAAAERERLAAERAANRTTPKRTTPKRTGPVNRTTPNRTGPVAATEPVRLPEPDRSGNVTAISRGVDGHREALRRIRDELRGKCDSWADVRSWRAMSQNKLAEATKLRKERMTAVLKVAEELLPWDEDQEEANSA